MKLPVLALRETYVDIPDDLVKKLEDNQWIKLVGKSPVFKPEDFKRDITSFSKMFVKEVLFRPAFFDEKLIGVIHESGELMSLTDRLYRNVMLSLDQIDECRRSGIL